MATVTKIVSVIVTALTAALKWLIKTTAGKALIKTAAKISFLAFFLLALAAAGFLPRSPFAVAITFLVPMIHQVPYMRYVNAFIPFVEIIAVTTLWLSCIVTFHGMKVIFRKGKVIK
jgi:hypothetical protein